MSNACPEPYYADDTTTLLLGDALQVIRGLPDESVHCVVTSPPYWGLRDYGVDGQLGLERTPSEYVAGLTAVFSEVARVLDSTGTCWLNLGDTYTSKARGSDRGWDKSRLSNPGGSQKRQAAALRQTGERHRGADSGLAEKNLVGIPWRVALALQDAGWYIRSEIIWAKRNFMPEAVTDRPTRAHEQIFLLTRSPRYFYDAGAIREQSDPDQEEHNRRYAREYDEHTRKVPTRGQPGNVNSVGIHSRPGPGGRNARSVWTISTTPSRHEHYAAFPVEIPRRCIAAGCPPGGTVLDPFNGTGTTGEAARRLGRRYIGIDLSAAYLDITVRRYAQAVIA